MNQTSIETKDYRLRIAVLSRNFNTTGGGAERYSISLVEQLSQKHEIHVFAQHFDQKIQNVLFHKISHPLNRPRWINQIWFATATWWKTRSGFDVVHSHENTWHGQVQTVHVLPIKHNLFHDRSGWRYLARWFKVAMSPRLLVYLWMEQLRYRPKASLRIVLTSGSLKAIMAKTYSNAVEHFRTITPGINQVAAKVNPEEKLTARLSLGLPVQGQCILFVGNDYRKKGLPTILESLKKMPDPVHLAVVGNAVQIPLFQELVKQKDLEHRVFFLGNLKDISQAYRAADCLAHPTLEDTFAMVVLEALSYGLPVVVSRTEFCGIAELLTHETNALILQNPRDSNELANALTRLLTEHDFAATLINHGQVFAQSYLWSEIAKQQEQIYLEVSEQK